MTCTRKRSKAKDVQKKLWRNGKKFSVWKN